MRVSDATLHALQHQLDVLEAAVSSVYDDPEGFAEGFVPKGADGPCRRCLERSTWKPRSTRISPCGTGSGRRSAGCSTRRRHEAV